MCRQLRGKPSLNFLKYIRFLRFKLRTSVPRHNEMSASKSTPTLLPSASLHLASQSSTALDSPQPSIYKTRRGDSLPDNSSSIVQTRDENQPRRYGSDMNGTYFDSIYGPTDRITDPELRRAYGVSARKRLAGTPNAFEHLDTCTFPKAYRMTTLTPLQPFALHLNLTNSSAKARCVSSHDLQRVDLIWVSGVCDTLGGTQCRWR